MTWLAPAVLAVLVMLPRLAAPQFGLLDDGFTLEAGERVVGRWSAALHLIPATGRFFPAHWVAQAAIVGSVGARPLAFFLINTLILVALLAILARLVGYAGGGPAQALVAMVVFALCGPTIESFYTLSKPEPLQLAWMAGALLATAAAATAASGARRAGLIASAAALSLIAYASKETSLVLVPISLGWLALEYRARGDRSAAWRFAVTYAAVNVAAAAVFLMLRAHYAPLGLDEGTYTRAYALDRDVIAIALFRIAAWLIRAFAFLLPLLALTLVRPPGGRPRWGRPLRYAVVWMGGWLAVFLPWPATFEYYLLPFALGAAVVAGLVVGDGWDARGSWLARLLLALGALLWLGTVVNAVADARVQLAVDRANADIVAFLAGLPARSRVVLNTAMNEYHLELPRHLARIARRPDLVVEPPAPATSDGPAPATGDRFVVTPELANRPWPTVRLALDEPGVARDHAMRERLLTGAAEPVYRTVRHTRFVEMGLHRLLCRIAPAPLLDPAFCPGDRPLVDRRLFTYGWQVHRLMRPVSDREPSRHGG